MSAPHLHHTLVSTRTVAGAVSKSRSVCAANRKVTFSRPEFRANFHQSTAPICQRHPPPAPLRLSPVNDPTRSSVDQLLSKTMSPPSPPPHAVPDLLIRVELKYAEASNLCCSPSPIGGPSCAQRGLPIPPRQIRLLPSCLYTPCCTTPAMARSYVSLGVSSEPLPRHRFIPLRVHPPYICTAGGGHWRAFRFRLALRTTAWGGDTLRGIDRFLIDPSEALTFPSSDRRSEVCVSNSRSTTHNFLSAHMTTLEHLLRRVRTLLPPC